MGKKIKKLYVIHHSHTDIGYTDLQERIIYAQQQYIKDVLEIMRKPENKGFRWNCETYFCVEQFLKEASKQEQNEFFELVRNGQIGISGSYLNFTDLVDSKVYQTRLKEATELFQTNHITMKTAMFADINGISMGQRDAMMENGIEFLYTNIHCHHGMYPLYQNQTPFYWESKSGKRLLVWNGEHYCLGNALGLKPNKVDTFMGDMYFGKDVDRSDDVKTLHKKLSEYITLCEEHNYKYDFIITSVSGEFSDNAPPSEEILRIIEQYNDIYKEELTIEMMSLQELYEAIKDQLTDVPVYQGDFTDWWANGVGSTPYAVKHYKDAVRLYHLCERLDETVDETYKELRRVAQDNQMLYAEHTWGHSSTITNPYDTMVLNLDMRKSSYASKAHESAALTITKIRKDLGDTLRYYSPQGTVCTINTTNQKGMLPVEFFVENWGIQEMKLEDVTTGRLLECQVTSHPRGKLITFCDEFQPKERKEYKYSAMPETKKVINSRVAYTGSEGVHDIVNDYDSITYKLPYHFENSWFSLSYEVGKGITEFINKKTGNSLLSKHSVPFFTPIYEETKIRSGVYEERRRLGRNIRGIHATVHEGVLKEVECLEKGPIYTELALLFELKGTSHAKVIIRFYETLPRIEYRLQVAKQSSINIESLYMPMTVSLNNQEVYLKKGSEPFRPGVDQIPGTCMEYYMSDNGVAVIGEEESVLLSSLDVPLVAFGPLKHHEIKLCDQKKENNDRPFYSWIMNNTWETNFNIDIGGYSEFRYILSLEDKLNETNAFEKLEDQEFGTYTFIIE